MIDYVRVQDVDIKYLISALDVQKRKKAFSQNEKARARTYRDGIFAFDIETTTISEIHHSIMYIWQFQADELTIIGRTWDEFKTFCEQIASALDDDYIVVFVHNLSFEFQYLSEVFKDSLSNIFVMDARKVLKFDVLDHIEFRCSYFHSNMRLEEYTKKMNVKDFKLDGDKFNYAIKRYPWTPLSAFSDYEIRYVINDVKGLVQAIKTEMLMYDDNLYSFPLTSTGYVRRDTKHVLGPYKDRIRYMLPNIELMRMLREAFRGGDTHANRFFAGTVIDNRVIHSVDISSSYPSVLVSEKYPMSRFYHMKTPEFAKIYEQIKSGKYAFVMNVILSGVKLRDHFFGCPYISKAKCSVINNGVFDNGRVLSADLLVITITDIDLMILLDEYDFEIEVVDAYRSKYGSLPFEYIDLIIGYYEKKTKLKGDPENELYYNKTKALLNSLYGMMAQNPLKPEILYVGNNEIPENEKNGEKWPFCPSEKDDVTLLGRYNATAFLCYQWGVWCTCHARKRLHQGIHYVIDHGGEFLYTDTDSIKYYGDVDFTDLNNKLMQKHPFALDSCGKRYYMGVWEHEDDMTEFVTLGAKKYAYRTKKDGKLHVTVAGVSKKDDIGAQELEKNGGISAFKIGFKFVESGGSEVTYNDQGYGEYVIDGHSVNIIKNIVIEPSFYTLGATPEYQDLINACGIEREMYDELYFMMPFKVLE